MTAVALLADLRRRGVELYVEGERLRYRGPRGAYTDSDRSAVRRLQVEMRTVLATLESLDQDGTAGEWRARYRDDLSDDLRERLVTEAAEGDPLARLILLAVGVAT